MLFTEAGIGGALLRSKPLTAMAFVFMLGLSACTYTPVDPIVPVRATFDTNIKANQVNFSVSTESSELIVMQRRNRQLLASVHVHKDTTSADSAVRNYVLRDSAVLWSIVSGPGSITQSGLYSAPLSMAGTSAEVLVSARASVDPKKYSLIRIIVRKPNYQPVGASDYWVRDVYPIDSVSGLRDETKVMRDSVFIAGTQSIDGRLATRIVRYRNAKPHDTTYVINDNNTVYHYVALNDKLNITALQSQWLKIIDPNMSSWTAYDTSFVNQTTTFNGQAAVLNGSIRIVNTLVDADSVQLNGLRYEVQKVQSLSTVDLVIVVNSITIPIRYSRSTTQWLSDNVGVLRSVEENVQAFNQSCNCCIKVSEESVLAGSNLR